MNRVLKVLARQLRRIGRWIETSSRFCALASRVRVEIENTQEGKFLPATVRVRTTSGAELEATATQLPGTPSNPMPESELHAKALACFGTSVRPMQHDAVRRFAARITAVDTVTDMREFHSPA